jgi:hypothetical protein
MSAIHIKKVEYEDEAKDEDEFQFVLRPALSS